jgi:hypothetical protein
MGAHQAIISPVPKCRTDGPAYFVSVQWRCKNIVASEVQDFSPEPFVGQPGYNNNGWRLCGTALKLVQDVLPSSIRQMTIGQYHSNVGFVEQNPRIIQRVRQVQLPPRMTKDLAQPDSIFPKRKYGHNIDGRHFDHDWSPAVAIQRRFPKFDGCGGKSKFGSIEAWPEGAPSTPHSPRPSAARA